jgi:hypothetical protein
VLFTVGARCTLARLLRRPRNDIAFDGHYTADGAIVDKRACALGCAGNAELDEFRGKQRCPGLAPDAGLA